ncbi:MAG: glycosyltransferase, partial [Acidobacteriaceae bacterium]|nr:glycosyltransferase [Acidobacteriaceae bacterium]
MPDAPKQGAADWAEHSILQLIGWFYGLARVLMAPNQALVDLLAHLTGKQTFLMQRGADTVLFNPAKRTREDGPFTLGYVGRVTPEKSVRLLADVERSLIASGIQDFRFLIVGDGSEREWLQSNLKNADFAGVLSGEALAQAYANMDLFVFPSETDTFGNVILEAFASGVPVVVTASGGPKFLVREGDTGMVAPTPEAFISSVQQIMANPQLHARMRVAARNHALSMSWDSVFEKVQEVYRVCLSM